jgi:multisubunit Na+/H+ antiporter MnhB subunit
MDKKKLRYKKMELIITVALGLAAVLFLVYLIAAGVGATALKITCAVISILVNLAVLYYLYITKELLRRRSLWMTLGAACIIVCILFSLILNFPCPPYTLPQA